MFTITSKNNPCNLCHLCTPKAAKQPEAEGSHFCVFRDFCVTSFSPSGENLSALSAISARHKHIFCEKQKKGSAAAPALNILHPTSSASPTPPPATGCVWSTPQPTAAAPESP